MKIRDPGRLTMDANEGVMARNIIRSDREDPDYDQLFVVKYRDFRFIVPFIVQFGLYISPVGFSSSIVPEQWRFLYSLNPMVGVIDGFRWSILGGESKLYWQGFSLSLGLVFLMLITGISYFRKMERTFADVI